MRRYILAFAVALVTGCSGTGSTTVTPSSAPPGGGDGRDGGVAMPGGGSSGGGDLGSASGGGGMGGTSGADDMGTAGGGDGGGIAGGGGNGDGGAGAACTPGTIESVGGGGGSGVAVDDVNVYYQRWTGKLGPDEAFAVAKATFTSGPEVDIGTIDGGITRGRMFTDGRGLWAIDVGCLEHYDPASHTFVDVACDNVGFYQFAQDDGGLYGTGTDGVLRRVDKASGTVAALSTAHQWAGGVAVAGGWVYFAGDGHILRVATTGGPEQLIVQNAAGAHQLAADASHVYYGDGAGRVFSTPATPNASTTLLVTVGLGITMLESDDARLYFSAQVDASNSYGQHYFDSIEEIGKDGSGHVQLAPKVDAVLSMALDGSYVYWAGLSVQCACK